MLTLVTLLGALCAAPTAIDDTVRVDCGSTQSYRAADGRLFSADQFFTNGQPYINPAINNIAGTADDALYFTERSAPRSRPSMRYNIPMPAGDYLIRLHLAELYNGATGGPTGANRQRVFSVQLEGRRVLINYDLHAAVGPMTAVVKECRATITDGFATLNFLPVIGEPTVAAIEVLRLPTGSVPSPCSWTPRAAVSLERKEGQCAVVNNQMYTFGGYYTGLQATNLTQKYDLAADQWTTLAPMPLRATHTAGAVVGSEVWVVGGFVGNYPGVVTNAVQVYDTQANTWRKGPPLPLPRGSGAAAVVGKQLHFFGGLEPNVQTDSPLHYVLDVDNESASWQLAAPLPMPRCHLGGATLGGKIYALGGQHGHSQSVTFTSLVHEYDPLTDIWTQRADFPSPRSHFETTVTVLDGRILTVGGFDGFTNYEDVLSYDPALNQWSELCQLPLTLGSASAKVVGSTLIVGQGESDNQPGPETATRTTILNSSPSNVLSFSRNQLTTQVASNGTGSVSNFLWTLSGTAYYTFNSSAWPVWLTVLPSAATGTTNPLGQAISFRINAAGLSSGIYSANVQANSPGYSSASTTISLTVTHPLATTPSQILQANLFPNPASNQATLKFRSLTKQRARMELRSSHGQLVWQGTFLTNVGD
ncbi:MAG TPA: malectin domain-containing carbohydrate-binding protein, partial [Hymenobacter sp.]